MANSSAQIEAEKWIIDCGLNEFFPNESFKSKKLELVWGGMSNFNAVNENDEIVCSISTSSAKTATDKLASAKIQKLKADALYLLNIRKSNVNKIMVFTEESMLDYFQKETENGRFPDDIRLLYIKLPNALYEKVLAARKIASDETSPER